MKIPLSVRLALHSRILLLSLVCCLIASCDQPKKNSARLPGNDLEWIVTSVAEEIGHYDIEGESFHQYVLADTLERETDTIRLVYDSIENPTPKLAVGDRVVVSGFDSNDSGLFASKRNEFRRTRLDVKLLESDSLVH